MEEFVEKDSFEFGNNLNNEESNFEYNNINGLGESNYENEDLFTSDVVNNPEIVEQVNEVPVEVNSFNPAFDVTSDLEQNNFVEETVVEPIVNENNSENVEQPINVFEIPVENVNDEVIEQPINFFFFIFS